MSALSLLAYGAPFCYIFGFFSRPLLYAGFLVQFAYVFGRGVILGRVPLVGIHDTMIFFASSLVAFSIPFYPLLKEKKEARWMLAALASVISAGALLARPHTGPLPPVLNTYWFELHVAFSFFSYALFGLGAILGAIYIREEDAAIEKKQYKAVFMGYLLFSVSMIAGGIWAYLAWGTYWLWTPKELWTSLLWLYYSLYLHLRFMKGWHGRRAAWAGALGFGVVLFTYLGVGLLMKSSHSF